MKKTKGRKSRETFHFKRQEGPLKRQKGPLTRQEGPLTRQEGPLKRQEGPFRQCCGARAGAARSRNFWPEVELVYRSFGSGSAKVLSKNQNSY
jgi:hypothetical protein